LECTEGEIKYNRKIKISFIPDRFPKLPFNVESYLMHMGKIQGLSTKYINDYISEYFRHLNMPEDFRKTKISKCSRGTIQKVNILQALITKPDLLILDEPFSELDTHLRGQAQIQMQKLVKQFGKSVLIATHSRDEAYCLCSRIALVDDGKILAFKKTKALFSDPESRQAAIMTGVKNIVDAKKIGEHELAIPAWGIRLTVELPLRDELCAVAIRAHYFNTKTPHNRYNVNFVGRMEEPFEYILQFRYENQDDSSPDIWWRLPKDKIGDKEPSELGVAPQNVMPLYE